VFFWLEEVLGEMLHKVNIIKIKEGDKYHHQLLNKYCNLWGYGVYLNND